MKTKCAFKNPRRPVRAAVLCLCLGILTVHVPMPVLGQANFATPYTFTTLAGAGVIGAVDGIGGTARFSLPAGVAVDSAGNIYVADNHNYTIRKVTPTGLVTTLAGLAGKSGSADGTGSAARFNGPVGVAVDSAGNVYVADGSIRRVTPGGVVTTLAGGLGNAGVAVDSTGNVYVATGNQTICEVTPSGTNWVVTTLAGLAGKGGSADGTGSDARFNGPSGVALDGAGNLYVADTSNNTIRKMTPAGTNWVVTTLAGVAGYGATVDGTNGSAQFNGPTGLSVDGAGNIFVAEQQSGTIREVAPEGTNWVVTTIAGSAGNQSSADGTNSAARFNYPLDVAVNSDGDLYVADLGNNTIRQVTPLGTNWVVTTLAGVAGNIGSDYRGGAADGTNGAAQFNLPLGVAVDTNSNVYVADYANSTIRKVTPAGVVTTLAGVAGAAGNADGTNGTARFNYPCGVAVESSGSVYVADTGNGSIRQVTPAGVVTTLANGIADPTGVAVDSAGNVYVATYRNNTICEVMPMGTNWVVATLAGLAGNSGTNDGVGAAARFNGPAGVAVDSVGNVYVADQYASTIRKVMPMGTNWVVTTIAGLANNYGASDGTNSAAQFNGPDSVAVDGLGNIYVADSGNSSIRKITPMGTNWVVTTVAGYGPEGVDGTGSEVGFSFEYQYGCVAADPAGNLYVADSGDNTIRKGYPDNSMPMPVLQPPGVNAGQFGFGITGVPNLLVDMQYSRDLSHWQLVGTYMLVNGSNYFVSPNPSQGNQFFRAHVH